MKIPEYAQMIRHMTRDKTTDVPGSMAHGLRMASAETDAVKDMINKQYGPGTMKYGSEIPQPSQRPDVIEIDAINSFVRRNPAAEGGRIKFYKGMSAKKAPKKITKTDIKSFQPNKLGYVDSGTIKKLDPNYLGDFKGGDLERPKKVYKSGTPGSVLDDAIEIRTYLV